MNDRSLVISVQKYESNMLRPSSVIKKLISPHFVYALYDILKQSTHLIVFVRYMLDNILAKKERLHRLFNNDAASLVGALYKSVDALGILGEGIALFY